MTLDNLDERRELGAWGVELTTGLGISRGTIRKEAAGAEALPLNGSETIYGAVAVSLGLHSPKTAT